MYKPRWTVRVIEWSKAMKLKRRFEVRVVDLSDPDENPNFGDHHVALDRFTTRERAERFAKMIRYDLKHMPR